MFNGLGVHLSNLSRLSNAKTRSISAENFNGEKGKGGMAGRLPRVTLAGAGRFPPASLSRPVRFGPWQISKGPALFSISG